MKTKTIILIITGLIIGLTFFYIVALGYGGGKAVRPVKPNEDIIKLEKEIQKEVNSETVNIDVPRNYEIENCNKYGFQEQKLLIHIGNDSLKSEKLLEKYATSVNERLQKIFPYNKQCYDSVIIQTQYFDNNIDSTIDKRFSFPMIK